MDDRAQRPTRMVAPGHVARRLEGQANEPSLVLPDPHRSRAGRFAARLTVLFQILVLVGAVVIPAAAIAASRSTTGSGATDTAGGAGGAGGSGGSKGDTATPTPAPAPEATPRPKGGGGSATTTKKTTKTSTTTKSTGSGKGAGAGSSKKGSTNLTTTATATAAPVLAPTITSDKPDYSPGDKVRLTGEHWATGEVVHIVVNDTLAHTWSHTSDVTATGTGKILDVFKLPSWFVASYDVTATGPTSGTATTRFTDLSIGTYDQCSNDDGDGYASGDTGCRWINGNLQSNNSTYHEGDSTPQRLWLTGFAPGTEHTVTFQYGTTKGASHAYDYLTRFDSSETWITLPDRCDGITGCSTASEVTHAIPNDPNVPLAFFSGTREFVMRGAAFTGATPVSTPVLASGQYGSGDSETSVTVTFTTAASGDMCATKSGVTTCTVAIWFGAHIAKTSDWTGVDGDGFGGATSIPGSPYHVSLQDVDNGAAGGRDNQMQAGAIVVTQALHLRKLVTNDDGGTAVDTAWTLTATGTGGSPTNLSGTTPVDSGTGFKADTYTLGESGPTGYTGSAWSCVLTGTNTTVPVNTSQVAVGAGQDITCTITNDDVAPQLKLVKSVTNDNGGTKVANDWDLTATGTSATFTELTPASADATFHDVTGGVQYTLTETTVAGYSTTGVWSCTGTGGTFVSPDKITVDLGGSVTCTITNNDISPQLIVIKHVINDNGGTAVAADFTIDSGGINDTPDNFAGAESPGTTVTLDAGAYNVSESGPFGYDASYSADCSGTIAVGETKTCTVTNDDRPGHIIIKKITKPSGSTTSFSFDAAGTGYVDFSLLDGQQNDQTLDAGSYSAQELVPAGWVLTGIGGSTDPNAGPTDCEVDALSGSTGSGDLNTQTASITLEIGGTVTCTFENTAPLTTRTQGFWATHPQLADIAWFGGTAFGHTFPGVTATAGIGDTLICGRQIDTLGKLMGAFWANIAKTSNGTKRTSLDQARMQLLQQLIAAELNASAFGAVPSAGSFAAWEAALCGTDIGAIKTALSQAASFNESGDSGVFTPGTSADAKNARAIASIPFWDIIKP